MASKVTPSKVGTLKGCLPVAIHTFILLACNLCNVYIVISETLRVSILLKVPSISKNAILIIPIPPWIHSNIKREVYPLLV